MKVEAAEAEVEKIHDLLETYAEHRNSNCPMIFETVLERLGMGVEWSAFDAESVDVGMNSSEGASNGILCFWQAVLGPHQRLS